MSVFIVHDERTTGAAYLAEILTTFGISGHECCPLQHALNVAAPNRDMLVLPAGTSAAGIEAFLQQGGGIVAIHPDQLLEQLAGLKRSGETDVPFRLRLVQPVCYGSRGEALWTLGPRRTYELCENDPNGKPIAFSYQAADTTPDNVGIAEYSIGDGCLVFYAYDPAECIVRLRQGYPERADFLPPGQITPRAAFLHLPNPPQDTFWRPTADLHALLLCETVRRLLERSTPVPTLWHLPHGAASILLFSGDEDAAPRSADNAEMRDLESHGAAMNLYVFPDDTPLGRQDIAEFAQRGHTVSVHPFLSNTAGQPPQVQIAEAESQVQSFQEKFGWPVRTVRNHSYMWPGYMKIPELWERLGIGMDCNFTSIMRGDSMEWGPFAKLNAAMPLRFAREDGTLIDVFQQPTHLNDDQMSHPTSPNSHKYSVGEADVLMERLLDDAMNIYHSPICVNFHPENFVKFSGDPARALLKRAQSLKLPIWSVDRWHDFWRARASWKMTSSRWDGVRLEATFEGLPCEGLALELPADFQRNTLQRLHVNGNKAELERLTHRGRAVVQVMIPAQGNEFSLNAEYSQKEKSA